jgi:hypothetical protein
VNEANSEISLDQSRRWAELLRMTIMDGAGPN